MRLAVLSVTTEPSASGIDETSPTEVVYTSPGANQSSTYPTLPIPTKSRSDAAIVQRSEERRWRRPLGVRDAMEGKKGDSIHLPGGGTTPGGALLRARARRAPSQTASRRRNATR